MRLNAIGLRNFKAFGPALQTIPIKPITLVFGKNSAGKSSLLHWLLWLNHATTRGETDIHEPVAANGTVNLGGFDACINQGSRREEKDWLHINIHVANPLLRTESAKWLGNVSEFVVRMAVKRGNSISEPGLSNFKIDVDGQTLFYGSPYHSGRSASALVNWDHPVIPLKEKLTKRALKAIVDATSSQELFNTGLHTVLPRGIEIDFFGDFRIRDILNKEVPQKATKKTYWSLKECRLFIFDTMPYAMTPVLEQIAGIITGLRYLPPLRSIPARFENLRTCRDPAWKKLAEDSSLVNSVNRTLNNLDVGHQLDVRKLVPEAGGNDPSDYLTQLRIRDTRTNAMVNLQDVGVGTGQVLPIVIEAHACKNRLIVVEQPEVHVHPALQAKLGDVFIESALGENKNTFLLETHSEHLILRILRRIRESTEKDFSTWSEELKKACGPDGIRPEDVAVLYVEPGEEGARVIELPVTSDGDFSRPWPDGFFSERSKELF